MEKIKKAIVVTVLIAALSGCSTAGPFITSISSDGKGGLIIQKGYVEHNSWTGQIGNKEAGESKIQLLPEDKEVK